MKTITIIFTGLIALVPSQNKKELLALLAWAPQHEAKILFEDDSRDPIVIPEQGVRNIRLLEGDEPAIPQGGFLPMPNNVALMGRLRKGVEAYGPVKPKLIEKELKDWDFVIARVRVPADRVSHSFHRGYPPPLWHFKRKGVPGDYLLTLADAIEVQVRLKNPKIELLDENHQRVERDDLDRPIENPIPISGTVTIANEPDKDSWCEEVCETGNKLTHFARLFDLSATVPPIQLSDRWIPTTTLSLCHACREDRKLDELNELFEHKPEFKKLLDLLGNKPVRCPGALFDRESLKPW